MGIPLAKKQVDNVIEVVRKCNRVLKLSVILQNTIATIILACLPNEQKDHFYDISLPATSKINDNDLFFVAGDFNGHVGL